MIEGTEVLLGVAPAESLRGRPVLEAERGMHGSVPSGKGYYHVNVSLHDSATRAEIA